MISKQLRANHIPGATVSVVKDGQLFFAKGYGSADLQEGRPVNAQTTLFRIGSVSKPFTATAVLQLAEQGKLNLHADVNIYLKTFHLPATYPEPITLAHLLTHTAGFESRATGMEAARTTSDLEPLGQLLAEHIPARVRPPGELTAYSNYGYALAGYIVEQVSGMPYAQYVEQHIFQRLRMRSSPHLSRWLAGVLCALNVLLVIGLLLFLFEQLTGIPADYYYGVPPLLTAVFILALVSAGLSVGVVVFAILAWWGRFWSVGRRVHYSLVALAALALTWQLVYCNLLGFRA